MNQRRRVEEKFEHRVGFKMENGISMDLTR